MIITPANERKLSKLCLYQMLLVISNKITNMGRTQ